MPRTLTIFPAGDPAGAALAREISSRAERQGYRVDVNEDYAGFASLRACLCDTAVIYDLSGITEGSQRLPSKAFRALTALHAGLQHVLVVSRDYLPLNVVPPRRGGAPAYPFPATVLPGGHLVEPAADDGAGDSRRSWIADRDESLLTWIQAQLADVADGAAVPTDRCTSDQWDKLAVAMRASDASGIGVVAGIEKAMMDASHDWHQALGPHDQAFVSYRGGYHTKVESLARDVRSGRVPGIAARPVRVVRPGELAMERELLSEGRRWMVLSLLDDMLRASTELWIYETDDYLKSWWTLAELVAAAYIDDGEHIRPTIKTVAPSSHDIRPSGLRYRIELAETDRREIARFMSNARPDGVSPELALQHRLQRLLFRVRLGRPFLRLMQKAAGSTEIGPITRMMADVTDPELDAEFRQHLASPEEFEARINHPSYLPRFWDDILLDRAVLDGGADYSPDVAAFLAAPERMIRVSARRAAAAVRGGGWVTADDGTRLRIAEFAPRYLWRATRLGGLVGGGLRRLPTYYAADR